MASPIQLAGLPTLQLVQGESVSPKTQEVSSVRIRSVLSHSTQAIVEGALISLLVVGLMAGTAFAAKGGGHQTTSGGGGSLSVKMVTDANGNGSPNVGDTISFNVSTTATDKPWVKLNCTEGGSWVYTSSAGFFAAYAWAPNFTLSSTMWSSGAADCTATLYKVGSNGKISNLASLGFPVGG
jgi:hypothetical protein